MNRNYYEYICNHIVFSLIIWLVVFVTPTLAMCDGGDNLIEPRIYDGNLLIFNEGHVSYSIYTSDIYLGTINNNQGMYVNETLNYQLYASYNEIRDITDVEVVKKKFNQWWLIIVICVFLLIAMVKVYKVIIR